jgi:hypothetical protein
MSDVATEKVLGLSQLIDFTRCLGYQELSQQSNNVLALLPMLANTYELLLYAVCAMVHAPAAVHLCVTRN